MTIAIGAYVERYVVEAEIGRGGLATVFRVRHRTLGTVHALKVLALSSPSLQQRLVQEGRIQARLRHPNVVPVTDVVDVDGAPALLMDFVDGPSLADWLDAAGPLALAEVERLFEGVCAGVARAHAEGVIHRDLKPGNVLLEDPHGARTPRVSDFGVARVAAGEGDPRTTGSGLALGSPAYMAPEQFRDARAADARSDVFALGCLLYELLSGRRAFDRPDAFSTFAAVSTGDYLPLERARPDLPPRFGDAVGAALQPDPARRPGSVEALQELLRRGGAPARAADTLDPAGLDAAPLPPPGAELPEARAWADGVAFLFAWRGPFLGAVQAAEERTTRADAAMARATRALGPHGLVPVVPAVAPVEGDDEAHVAALEARVADLEAFEAAVAARARVGAWLERAGDGGPLGRWAVDARARLPIVDTQLGEGDTHGIAAARDDLERLLRGVGEARTEAGKVVAAVRAAARDTGDTFTQATRILGEDVKRLDQRLATALAARADADHAGPLRLLGGSLAGAAAGALAGYALGGGDGALRGGVGALCLGLGAGLASWMLGARAARDALRAVRASVEELRHDLGQARRDVLAELDGVRARWAVAVAEAEALDLSVGPLDTSAAEARLADPAAEAPLDSLVAALDRAPDPYAEVRLGALVAGGAVLGVLGALAVVVGGDAGDVEAAGVEAAVVAPGVDAPVEAAGGEAPGDVAAVVAPGVDAPGVDAPAAETRAARPSAPVPPLGSGRWAGTLGLATVEGSLVGEGGRIKGEWTLHEGGGDSTCAVRGTLAPDGAVRLNASGCAVRSLRGRLDADGRRLAGSATVTGTGDLAGATIQDAWELRAAD